GDIRQHTTRRMRTARRQRTVQEGEKRGETELHRHVKLLRAAGKSANHDRHGRYVPGTCRGVSDETEPDRYGLTEIRGNTKRSERMETSEFQEWVKEYYESRGWSDLDIFVRIGFLAEETGEVARAIRSLEIGRDRPDEQPESYDRNREELVGELGDVRGNGAVIANKYDISRDEVFEAHKEKLSARYSVR